MDSIKKLVSKYQIYINDQKLNVFDLENYENVRVESLTSYTIKCSNKIVETSVIFEEPFQCCGKIYLHDFHHKLKIPNLPIALKLRNINTSYCRLLNFCEEFAKLQNYSYVGFVHIIKSGPCLAGISRNYKVIQFLNTRSGNTLQEMYKIL